MSEHLKLARLKIEAACKMKPTDEHAVKLEEMLYCLLLHLEAQQETPGSASQPTEQPAPSSSEATEMAEETKPISSISWRQSYLVNQGGFHYSDPAQDILDWLSSHRLAGMGPEVEIGVTLTSKASTPPAGSASPSTAEPTPEASGVVGSREFVDSHVHEWHIVVGYPRRFRCFKCGDWYKPVEEATPDER